jgi:hypothetical protein
VRFQHPTYTTDDVTATCGDTCRTGTARTGTSPRVGTAAAADMAVFMTVSLRSAETSATQEANRVVGLDDGLRRSHQRMVNTWEEGIVGDRVGGSFQDSAARSNRWPQSLHTYVEERLTPIVRTVDDISAIPTWHVVQAIHSGVQAAHSSSPARRLTATSWPEEM